MIPKVIHYCWFGGGKLPNEVRKCIKSWKKMCPDYEIKRWDESNFDINCCEFIKTAYEAKAWAYVSDYARLKIIYDNGGIYLDTDVELLKSLDAVRTADFYIGLQQPGEYCNTGLGYGAIKNNKIVQEMLDEYNDLTYKDECKSQFTCPILNTKVIKRHGYKSSDSVVELNEIRVYPSKYLDPYSMGNMTNLLCKDTISIHHYSSSWYGGKVRLKQKIIKIIGIDNAIRIKKIIRK